MFSARTRPCLQYQIKRCSAPCVGYVTQEGYAELVDEARRFLSGRSHDVQQELASHMQRASDALEFETAAIYRNRIRALTAIQAHQDINVEGIEEADVVALHTEGGHSCIQVRSEEHTSELQSLMRNSYAVFCLKKKKTNT